MLASALAPQRADGGSMRRRHADLTQPGVASARAIETGLLAYTDAQLAALLGRLAGTATQPGAPGYNDDRSVFMHTQQRFPQLIVHAAVESDVVAALAFARETGLKVATRSGGHSTAGYSTNDQLVIDISAIGHVLIDREARVARVGAGATFRRLNLMLDAAGLHVPGGGCETVGVAGYMQGGGYGFTSRLFGMNCDSVRALRLVRADGRVLRATRDEEPDLFWAARGGTGNQFGVLVEIEYDLRPLDTLFGFGLAWPLDTVAGVETAAQALAILQARYTSGADAPAGIGMQALLINAPVRGADGAVAPQAPRLLVRGVFDGDAAGCAAALAPLTATLADPATQTEIWREGRYLELNEILLQSADPPGIDLPAVAMSTRPLVDGRIVTDFHDAAAWRRVVAHFLAAPDRTCFIAIETYGGAINAPAPDASAYVHRRDSLDLFAWAFWTLDAAETASVAWLDGFVALAEAMSSGRRYQNYPRRGATGFEAAYFGANLPRLRAIRAAADPEGRFDFEQSIGAEAP